MPRPRRNPVTGDLPRAQPNEPLAFTPTSTPTPTTTPTTTPTNAVELPFGLVDTFEIELPDFAELIQSAVGYEPNPSLPRVTDSDRATHAQIYREQINAADNLKDSLQVAGAYVRAATEGAKLARGVVRYATSVEEVRESLTHLETAKVKTAIAGVKLTSAQNELGYLSAEVVHQTEVFAHKLEGWKAKVEGERLKVVELQHNINAKYGDLLNQ